MASMWVIIVEPYCFSTQTLSNIYNLLLKQNISSLNCHFDFSGFGILSIEERNDNNKLKSSTILGYLRFPTSKLILVDKLKSSLIFSYFRLSASWWVGILLANMI